MKTQMMELADQVAKAMYTISNALKTNNFPLAEEALVIAEANLAALRHMLEEARRTDRHLFR